MRSTFMLSALFFSSMAWAQTPTPSAETAPTISRDAPASVETAKAEKPKDFSVPDDVSQGKTLNLCIDYFSQPDAEKKAAELKELTRRGMLSVKDHDLLGGKQKTLENGNTRCAMYMTRGIPLHEKGKFIGHKWVRTPKIVHVYDDKYYVSQSGIITRVYDRIPGRLPPRLETPTPKVAPPPVLMEAHPGQARPHSSSSQEQKP